MNQLQRVNAAEVARDSRWGMIALRPWFERLVLHMLTVVAELVPHPTPEFWASASRARDSASIAATTSDDNGAAVRAEARCDGSADRQCPVKVCRSCGL